jgi:hypothetical protein
VDDFKNTDGETETPEPGAGTTQGDTGNAEPGDTSPPKSGEDLSKLQSERDKETARANKLQKELDSLKAASAKDAGAQGVPPQVQEWIVAAQRRTRDVLYESNPKFKAYNVGPDLITGDTPAAMEASAKSLAEFVDTLEGNVRDQVLRDHGFDPEPRASTRGPDKSFKSMNSEEFNRLVDQALRG